MRFVVLLIAAIIAIAAGIAALQMTGKNVAGNKQTVQTPAANQPVRTVEVLVARSAVPVGTVIDESMIDKQPWPEHLVLEGFIVGGESDSNLIGKVARAPFEAREPFMSN